MDCQSTRFVNQQLLSYFMQIQKSLLLQCYHYTRETREPFIASGQHVKVTVALVFEEIFNLPNIAVAYRDNKWRRWLQLHELSSHGLNECSGNFFFHQVLRGTIQK